MKTTEKKRSFSGKHMTNAFNSRYGSVFIDYLKVDTIDNSKLKTNRAGGEMKKRNASAIIFLLVLFLLLALPLQAQESDEFDAAIRLGGRYVVDYGVELRIFPENRQLLVTGFQDGFILERRQVSEEAYSELARIVPVEPQEWEEAIRNEQDTDLADHLDLAYAFLTHSLESGGGLFELDAGIGELKERKSDEDFEFAVFILGSVKYAKVAEFLGLGYIDETAVPGETYSYRVRLVTDPSLYRVISESYQITAVVDEVAYENPVYIYEGDEYLNFVWEENDLVSGYYIERKSPGQDGYIRLNEAPLYNLTGEGPDGVSRGSFSDEGLENYIRYEYRFKGYTMFGELVTFAEVDAMPRDRTPPEPPFLENPEHVKPREVEVRWHMNDPPAPDLMGFVVGRSSEPEGEFQVLHPELLSDDTRIFTDTTFVEGRPNYYVVQAVDTAWNVSSSLPAAVTLIDTIPPSKPVFLSGIIDSTGVVTLEIERNEEADLMGYRLFKANDPEHEFSVIFEGFVDDDSLRSDIPTVFSDTITLNSLTPNVYYKIRALDFNFNQSEFSEVMVITRPDTIPPVTPVFKRVVTGSESVELHVALSSSHDVATQKMYRKMAVDDPWVVLDTLQNEQTLYVDTNVQQGVLYYYTLQAVDYSGNQSGYAHPVMARPYDSGVRPPVENLSFNRDEDGLVHVTWDYHIEGDHVFFVVYRQNDDGRFLQYQRTELPEYREAFDYVQDVSLAVKAFTRDGGQSPLSETLVIE